MPKKDRLKHPKEGVDAPIELVLGKGDVTMRSIVTSPNGNPETVVSVSFADKDTIEDASDPRPFDEKSFLKIQFTSAKSLDDFMSGLRKSKELMETVSRVDGQLKTPLNKNI